MCRAHVKVFVEHPVRYDRGQVLRQRIVQLVVDARVRVAPDSRNPDKHKEHKDSLIVTLNKVRYFFKFRQQRLMSRLLDRLFKCEYHGRQYRDTADHTEDNALRHDDADIQTESKTHEAERDKSGDCCDG